MRLLAAALLVALPLLLHPAGYLDGKGWLQKGPAPRSFFGLFISRRSHLPVPLNGDLESALADEVGSKESFKGLSASLDRLFDGELDPVPDEEAGCEEIPEAVRLQRELDALPLPAEARDQQPRIRGKRR
jgi:hypothetical protein